MIRFVVDKIRTAPGPLRQPRLILADLAEEIVDLLETYLGHRDGSSVVASPRVEKETASTSSGGDSPREERPASTITKEKRGKRKKEDEAGEPDRPKPTLEDMDPRLVASIEVDANRHKQDYKILAILWDAKARGLGALSAKGVSQHGEKMGLAIRHENVRKVIRVRLARQVRVRTEGVGRAAIYRYELSDDGSEFFTSTYFE